MNAKGNADVYSSDRQTELLHQQYQRLCASLRGALAAGRKRRVLPASIAVFSHKKCIPREASY